MSSGRRNGSVEVLRPLRVVSGDALIQALGPAGVPPAVRSDQRVGPPTGAASGIRPCSTSGLTQRRPAVFKIPSHFSASVEKPTPLRPRARSASTRVAAAGHSPGKRVPVDPVRMRRVTPRYLGQPRSTPAPTAASVAPCGVSDSCDHLSVRWRFFSFAHRARPLARTVFTTSSPKMQSAHDAHGILMA